MPFNTRNIIIFVGLAVVFTSIYIFFIKSPSVDSNLVSSSANVVVNPNASTPVSGAGQNVIAQNFLSLLLNIKNIKLDDSIFSDESFQSLHDSSIVLVPDASAGRPNPFAQFGSDNIVAPSTTPSTPGTSSTPSNPSTPPSSASPAVPPTSAIPKTPATGAGSSQ